MKNNDLNQLKEYVESIPDCSNFSKEEEPEICTDDRTDGLDFLWHIWKMGLKKDEGKVKIDAGLYTSLSNLYTKLYGENPRVWNYNNYLDFYNRYKNTWLKERVELIMTQFWQRGSIFNKYKGFSGMTGKNIYTTLYISDKLNFGNVYKYVSPEIKLDKYTHGGGKNWLRSILNEMKEKSTETNSPKLLNNIISSWFDSIISPEQWDKTEQEFYQGIKQKRMYEMLDEKGWDMFANVGLVPSKWSKNTVTLYVHSCMRVMKKEKVCSSFEQGAIKYGFYTPYEQIEEELNEKLVEAVERVSGKLEKGYFNPAF